MDVVGAKRLNAQLLIPSHRMLVPVCWYPVAQDAGFCALWINVNPEQLSYQGVVSQIPAVGA